MNRLTAATLAQAKHLPESFVRDLGLRDVPEGVAIPYHDQLGNLLFERTRLSLDVGKRFLQPDGVPLAPYGLNRLEAARKRGLLILVEGESDCWTLWRSGLPALGLPGSSSARTLQSEHVAGFQQVFVVREPDQGGAGFIKGISERLPEIGFVGEAYEVSFDGFKDPSALYCDDPERFPERFQDALNHATVIAPGASAAASGISTLRVFDVRELLSLQLPPREFILEPIFRERETMMIYSWRGVGKTFLGLSIAHAIAFGGDCLRWRAPQPRRVLYVDGELPLQTLQERVARLVSDKPVDPSYLRFLTHDAQEFGLPDLGTREGQELFRQIVESADVIFFDSLSTLMRRAKENEAEGWMPMQEFLLELRRAGKGTVLLHHEGKGGTQRGTSKREDILDTVIHLRRPSGYCDTEGARFEVSFEKCRAFAGASAETFEARLDATSDRARWITSSVEAVNRSRAEELFQMGMSVRDVADELKISKSSAHRLKRHFGEVSQRPTA
jgi:hypothetical protein